MSAVQRVGYRRPNLGEGPTMKTVELWVDETDIRFNHGVGSPLERMANLCVLSGLPGRQRIEAIGTATVDRPTGADDVLRVVRPFDSADFDPDLAEAITRYVLAVHEGPLASIRGSLPGQMLIRLRWPGWVRLSEEHRRSYLNAVSRVADVEVNGRLAAHRSLIRALLFMGPKIETGSPRD
jgi:hypothetical protein